MKKTAVPGFPAVICGEYSGYIMSITIGTPTNFTHISSGHSKNLNHDLNRPPISQNLIGASNKSSFGFNNLPSLERLTTKKGTVLDNNQKVYLRFSEKQGFYASTKFSIRDFLGIRNAGISKLPMPGLVVIDHDPRSKIKLSEAREIVTDYNEAAKKILDSLEHKHPLPAVVKKPIPTPRGKASAETIYLNTGRPPCAKPRTSL